MTRAQRLAARVQAGTLYLLLFLLPISNAAIEIAFPILLISWFIEHRPTRWTTSVWVYPMTRRCLVALLAYLGVCALSVLMSDHPDLSLKGLIYKNLEYAFLFVIAADIVQQPAVAGRWPAVVLASACVVGLDAVLQELFGVDPLRGHVLTAYTRMTGPYTNPIDLATYMMVVIPVVLLQVVRLPAGTWRKRGGLALVGLLAGCLIRAASQSAWIGFVGGLTVLLIAWNRAFGTRRIRMGWVGLAVVAALLGLELGAFKRFDVGTQDRLFMWQAAWKMIQDRPILGHGLNTFMANYLDYWVGGERQPRYAHNCYLQVTAETGVLGLATFLWWLGTMVALWWGAVQHARRQDDASRAIVLGVGAGLSAFLIQAGLDTNFYGLRQAVLFWTLAGLATGVSVGILRTPKPRAAAAA